MDLRMIRGDDECFAICGVFGDSETPYPFEDGGTLWFTVKDCTHCGEIVLQKCMTEFDADGWAWLIIDHADTAGKRCGTYVYDIQLNTKDGKVKTVMPPSKFILGEEVTTNA